MKKCGHRCVAAGPGYDMDAKGFWVTEGLIGPEHKVPLAGAQVTQFFSNQHRFDVHGVDVCLCVWESVHISQGEKNKVVENVQPNSLRK